MKVWRSKGGGDNREKERSRKSVSMGVKGGDSE